MAATDTSLEALKTALRDALACDEVDFDKVSALSAALLKFDSQNVRFSVDASHVSRLGMELVARQETAVAELVKNAYDADATHVDLTFKSEERQGGVLEIWDNGSGMTREQLIDGFMRISTPDKVENPISLKFGRRRAGRKGIGRFAAQRLGSRLTIVTQTEDVRNALRVTIDWTKFQTRRDITAISNRIEETEGRGQPGTTLIIDSLNDAWSVEQMRTAYQYVSELIQPFPLAPVSGDASADPGFSATVLKQADKDFQLVADDWTLFFQHALAQIDGSVDEAGNGRWSIRSDRYNIAVCDEAIGPERDASATLWADLRRVRFRAYYFIPPEIPRMVRVSVRRRLRESGGIRVYLNGFRVLPYGAEWDDWLRLDWDSRRRVILPPHSNENFLGFAQLDDPQSVYFKEVSSREGLIENGSFKQLRQFIFSVLVKAVLRVAEARRKKGKASSKQEPLVRPAQTATAIAERLQTLLLSLSQNAAFSPATIRELGEIKAEILDLGATSELREEELLEELGMIRVLASLGLTIAEFTHEVALGFSGLKADARSITDLLSGNVEGERKGQRLLQQLDVLRSYVQYFERTVRDNVNRKLRPIEIRDAIQMFEALVAPQVERQRVEPIIKDVQGLALFTKPMHPSEWTSVLVNLFTNSLKAIKRANVPGRIKIRAGKNGDRIYLEFADNGDGIRPQDQDRVFDAFFTTSAPVSSLASEGEQLSGMGLGLKIVRDIVESVGGGVSLIQPPPGFSTCFRIEVPGASPEEIPKDAY